MKIIKKRLFNQKLFPLVVTLVVFSLFATSILAANTGIAKAESITFPDLKLEAAIRASIEKPSGVIDTSDIAGLTSLDVSNSGITDLTGLENCTSLTHLNLRFNQISDVSPLSGLTNLVELRLEYNQISDISSLSGLTNLTELWLSNNPISDVSSLSSLSNLETLYLVNIETSDMSPISSLTSLKGLYLSYNQIDDISFLSGLTNLISLDISVNQISDISSLSGLNNLTELWLGYNQIGDISSLSGISNLAKLRISDNQITDISALATLTNMTILTLNNNQINDISSISNLTKLTSLSLQDNQINDISSVKNLSKLMYLDLRDNEIIDISHLSDLSKLTYLDLGTNQIDNLSSISGLTKLVILNLDNNQIDNIEPLSYLEGLNCLNLSNNQISNVESLVSNTGISNGDTIYLSFNYLNTTSSNYYIPQLEERGVEILQALPPYADFTATILNNGESITVSFTDTSYTTEGITSWLWDFGDGQTSDENSPTHNYTKSGIYMVSLTVTEDDGDSNTVSKIHYFTLSKVLASQSVSSTSSTMVKSEDEYVIIEFPEGSLLDDAMVTIKEESLLSISACPGGFMAGDTCFSVDLTGALASGTSATVTVRYSTADLEACGGDPSQLTLSRYNETIGEWEILPTTVDTEAMTLTASTDHFSPLMVMADGSPVKSVTTTEPTEVTSSWNWFIVVASGLLVLSVVGGIVFISRRRKAIN